MPPRRPGSVRDQILDAAVCLLRENGVKKLAQPQVARAAGVPQGHLTYYFPRKFDLLHAVARRFIEMMGVGLRACTPCERSVPAGAVSTEQAFGALAQLVRDREHTRMLLGLIVEAETDASLREVLIEGAAQVRAALAEVTGRACDDPDVDVALATVWGMSLVHLLFGDRRTDAQTDALVTRLAQWFPAERSHANGGRSAAAAAVAAALSDAGIDPASTSDPRLS
jgi:AcrR family transcriptional regulator